MYSIQWRSERFKIIYLYKIKENLVPNVSSEYGLSFRMNGRRGCVCEIPGFPPGSKGRKARDNSFAWTACNLWNSLPRWVRDTTGEDVMCFKNKLDKALAFYPDVPRCSESGHTYDRNFRKSNSLCDHYGDAKIRRVIDKMDIV